MKQKSKHHTANNTKKFDTSASGLKYREQKTFFDPKNTLASFILIGHKLVNPNNGKPSFMRRTEPLPQNKYHNA